MVSLREHWSGLTLFIDDPRIPLANNYGERFIRDPAVGRKNDYGSGSQWSGRLAMMLFSIFATLALRKINPLTPTLSPRVGCKRNVRSQHAGERGQ